MNGTIKLYHAEEAGQRLDVFLARVVAGQSRSAVAAWIRAGFVQVNGAVPAKTGVKLEPGDRVEIELPPPAAEHLAPEPGPLEILFEDDALAVLDKPAGLVVHPAGPRRTGTLVNRLLHHFNSLSQLGGETRPGLVHRLDQETSGVMVVAKTDAAHRALAAQFAARKVEKLYLTVVRGEFKEADPIRIEAPIGRHPRDRKKMGVVEGGRAALTRVEVLQPLGHHSVVLARPLTGRTHQIRVHLAHVGHPVLGDTLYGYRPDLACRRLVRQAMTHRSGAYLHAWRLAFRHPAGGERMVFTAPLPEDFLRLLRGLGATDLEAQLALLA